MRVVRISLMKGMREGSGKSRQNYFISRWSIRSTCRQRIISRCIAEHDDQSLIYDPSYLDVPRTDSFIIVQITLNEGRALELEKLFYKTLAERLHGELGVRLEDVFINLVEVKKENWSFGNVIARYT